MLTPSHSDARATQDKIYEWERKTEKIGGDNRALVHAEMGGYETAVREMKRYLLLVPNASDARAAQDKIYDWERLDSK